MSADPWVGTVACPHRAVLARASTVAAWTDVDCCDGSSEAVAQWQVGIEADTPMQVREVFAAIGTLHALDQPVSATLARLSREDLPPCSILLTDRHSVAALSWGRPLGLVEIDRWEYAITTRPPSDHTWTAMPPGTLVDLADCGPTVFSLTNPYPAKESA